MFIHSKPYSQQHSNRNKSTANNGPISDTHKQRLSHQLLRSRRHRIAAQQNRRRRQAGRHRRHKADQRLANVGGHRHAELEQQPLAERADQHLEQFQQSAAAAQKLHVHAREQATAADLDAAVALLRWPMVLRLLAAAGHFDEGGRHSGRMILGRSAWRDVRLETGDAL